MVARAGVGAHEEALAEAGGALSSVSLVLALIVERLDIVSRCIDGLPIQER